MCAEADDESDKNSINPYQDDLETLVSKWNGRYTNTFKLPTPLIANTCEVFLNAPMITEIKKINNLE